MEKREKWTEGTTRVGIMITNKATRDKLTIMQYKRRLHYSLGTKQFEAFVFLNIT
jgi:hypothetical protein